MTRDFEKMGIYDLRNYARMMGVKSPTTLKRDELIEKINQIIEGGKPNQVSTKKGRPPRHKPTDKYMLDLILPDNFFQSGNDDYVKQSAGISISNLKYLLNESGDAQKTDNILFQGYFSKFSADYGIIFLKGYLSDYSKENIIVLNNLIDKYHLKDGDYVVGSAKFITSKNVMLASEIKNINNSTAESVANRISFDDIHPSYPTKQILLSTKSGYINFKVMDKICPIAKGARVAIGFEDGAAKNIFTSKMIHAFEKDGFYTFLISIGDKPEEIGELMHTCENTKFVEQIPSQSREQFFSKVQMILQNACRRVECGEDVAILFYDAKNFIHFFAQNCILSQGLNEVQANIVAENKFFDYFNLAKSSLNGSLTIIALNSTPYVEMQANCIQKINSNSYAGTDVTLDVYNSHTQNIEKIFDNDEYLAKLKHFYDILKPGNEEESILTLFD